MGCNGVICYREDRFMKITYIHHSSFSVEFPDIVFLFDYYAGELPEFPEEKEIYVFASHKHHDHFDLSVLSLALKYPGIHFILSRDIKMNRAYLKKKQVPEEAIDRISYIGKNAVCEYKTDKGPLKVETLTSTDEGVAFLLEYDGISLYHAGDLNWWTWIGETEKEYKDMERRFRLEMEKLKGKHFDVAFVPLDPRQEERYWWGFDAFMRTAGADIVFPMHFWKDYSVIDRLLAEKESEPYRNKVQKITEEGQEFIF